MCVHIYVYIYICIQTLYFCSRCGAYAETKCETKGDIGLTKPCQAPTPSSRRSLKRIMSGRHPTSTCTVSRPRKLIHTHTQPHTNIREAGTFSRDSWAVIDEPVCRPGIMDLSDSD